MPAETSHTRAIADRVARDAAIPEAISVLANDISGSDLTSLLLAVVDARSNGETASDILQRHVQDRFVRPSQVDLRALHHVEARMLASVPPEFDAIELSPLLPFSTHHTLGNTPQHNVYTTTRRSDVAADPTAGLALEAALRRKQLLDGDARLSALVKLATLQRVMRGQPVQGPDSFAHFGLAGLVTAGRAVGNHEFERAAMLQHISVLCSGAFACGVEDLSVTITDFSDRMSGVVDYLLDELASLAGVTATHDPSRTQAKGYYRSVCMKIRAHIGGSAMEYGDGGLVDWTQLLVNSRKERLIISGASIDRLAPITR